MTRPRRGAQYCRTPQVPRAGRGALAHTLLDSGDPRSARSTAHRHEGNAVLNEVTMRNAITTYLAEVSKQFASGWAVEHAYRPALKGLMETFEDSLAINDPAQSEYGAPDFVFLQASNNSITKGHAEAKDIGSNLDKAEHSDQLRRYAGYANLFLTDYLEFRFMANGICYQTISLGSVKGGLLVLTPENGEHLMRELADFMALPPEPITSGKRLAEIMGAKARLIRDNVSVYVKLDTAGTSDLTRIYTLIREMLVKDLDVEHFADMYAQTLVYGLFVARYGDDTPATFSRSEARDLVPKSNPFLRHFFDHLAGSDFDTRFAKTVDELCAVFRVSDVLEIVHRHLRVQDVSTSDRDPIIHFYEDFLQSYDADERKRMGAYYTPIPVVQYIVREIDSILRRDFNITDGLASSETTTYQVDVGQDMSGDRRLRRDTKQHITVPRVQVLDPAVGTATFLNELIKFVHQSFAGQEGRWPAYARDNLVPRLHGFELMMAPYTIAHLKLGMTLTELGVPQLDKRLNVMLTNSLEEGVPTQKDLFAFGLAEAVTDESRLAAEVKSERPVMVVLGNPPYSGVSSNNTEYANNLVTKYKVEPGGATKLQERKHWLNDDYVKFLAFAEDLIARNGSGVVGMITNNGYLDNPTFRGMRWHLTETFDSIYVLDLHGNAKKLDQAPDGTADQNVFDIQQGVAIILAVKLPHATDEPCKVFRADLHGSRRSKFDALSASSPMWQELTLGRRLDFTLTSNDESVEYMAGIPVNKLFVAFSNAAGSGRDSLNFAFDRTEIVNRMDFIRDHSADEIRAHFGVGRDSSSWSVTGAKSDVEANYRPESVSDFMYRPFDARFTFYTATSGGIYSRPLAKVVGHVRDGVYALMVNRKVEQTRAFADVFVTDRKAQFHSLSTKETNSITPLYVFDPAGDKYSNFDPTQVAQLTQNLTTTPSPERLFAYIYAVLHSPTYRQTYDLELRRDFPRIPIITHDDEFNRLAPLGSALIDAHLMRPKAMTPLITTFPAVGDDTVTKVRFVEGKVYINDTQYFGGVCEAAWNYRIGSFTPAQRWLTDRIGRRLSAADLMHYQRIIKALSDSGRIVERIG